MARMMKYIFYDLLRTRFVLLYTLFLWLITIALFQLDANGSKVVLSLLSVVLMVIPLVSVVFTTIHYFNSYEFMELMLAQPIHRRSIFLGQYLAVAFSLVLAFLIGVGLPLIAFGLGSIGFTLILVGVLLTLVFVSLAFLSSVITRDKAHAIGVALLFWFYFSLIYDGILLWIVYTFNDYPLEKITVALIALNPIDLGRILLLLQMDISALMGYTGAFYQQFFGGYIGWIFSMFILLLWALLPVGLAVRIFQKKDL
jgi:Cu-processing system permease protein